MSKEKEFNKVFIHAKGDPSSGIHPTTLEVSGFGMIADENMIDFIREELQNTFSEILDDYVSVEFDFEVKEKIEREE